MRMDRNNNQAIIYKLAKREQKNSQVRNFFTCITIACSTALIFAFILYLFGTQEEKLRILKKTPQVSYQEITVKQVEKLRQDKRIEWMGLEVIVGRKKVGTTRLSISWQDEDFMEFDHMVYTGKLPIKDNEIMIPQEYLQQLGKEQAKIGDSISLDLGDNIVRDYRISAILTNHSKAKNSQHIYVSLSLAMMMKGILEEDTKVNASVNMKDAIDFHRKEAEKQAKQIARDAGIAKKQTKLDEAYYMQASMRKLTIEDIFTLILVILLIITAAYFVIHNIFYISITEKVQEYGQMRTIGMTRGQIKSLIFQEGFYLALKGSFPGLIIGGLLGYALVPKGFAILNTVVAAVLCVFFSILCVGIAVRKPGKIAAEASPIEALLYTDYIKNKKTYHDKNQNNLTPKYLAVLNLKRNRNKSIWTMCSLILAGILVGTISSYVISYDPAASVEYSFPNGVYQLTINPTSGFRSNTSLEGSMKINSLLQAEDIMGEELKLELESLNHITNVNSWRYLMASTTLFGKENIQIGLNGISENDFELLKDMLYEGPNSYEELLQESGLIITNEYHTRLRKNPLSIGDYVAIVFYNGKGERKELSLPVLAIVKIEDWRQKNRMAKLPLSLVGSSFMMLNPMLDKLAGMNTTYGYEISTEPKKEKEAGIVLEEMYGAEEDLYLSSKAENREYYEKEYFSTKLILYALAIFLVIFGMINLVNTIITNIYSRRKEFGILQAVGMTKKQLRDMINKENAYYTEVASLCTLFFGSILGYAFVMTQIQMGIDMIYSYPWFPMILYLIGMLIVQKSLTVYGVKLLQKQSLTERMKIE